MKKTVKEKLKNIALVFILFFKIGLFSFGGGYAMLTMFETEFVERKKWLTHAELADIFAIAESTPGAVSINIATFIGTRRGGFWGGAAATLGVVLPAFGVIVGLSYVIAIVKDNFWVVCLFKGVRIGVLALIARSVVTFFKDMRKSVFSFLMMIAAFLIAFLTNVSVIYIILGAIVISGGAVAFLNVYYAKRFHTRGTEAYYSILVGKPQTQKQTVKTDDLSDGKDSGVEKSGGGGK